MNTSFIYITLTENYKGYFKLNVIAILLYRVSDKEIMPKVLTECSACVRFTTPLGNKLLRGLSLFQTPFDQNNSKTSRRWT